MAQETKNLPLKYGVVLFPGFQALDVFGPLDILNILSKSEPLELSLIAATSEPVSTSLESSPFNQSLVPTHTFQNAPTDLEVLLVPGGLGTRDDANIAPAVEFVKKTFPKLRFLLTVCTGSALAAKSGVLDGKQATTNKRGWKWASSFDVPFFMLSCS
jgi:putative intracellular protease/amidase